MAKPAVCWRCNRLIGMAKICPHCYAKQDPGIARYASRLQWASKKTMSSLKPMLLHHSIGVRLNTIICLVFVLQLVMACVFGFVREMSFLDALGALFQAFLLGPERKVLFAMGASSPYIAMGDWWGPLTATYLHGGVIHLGFNVLALSMLSPLILQLTSPWFFVLIYQVSGMMGFLWSAQAGAVSVGASGALFGLIGFGMVISYKQGGGWYDPLFRMLASWFLFAMLFGFVISIADNYAHLGGWMGGVVMGVLWFYIIKDVSSYYVKVLAQGLFVATGIGFMMSMERYTPLLIGGM